MSTAWPRAALVVGALALLAGCPNGAGVTCPQGLSLCNGTCIFVGSDPNNCGTCGTVCPSSLACINGQCACPGNLAACNDTCVDEQVDPNNCGGCGIVCPADNYCVAGSCSFACPAPNSVCTSGGPGTAAICTNLMIDSFNCGMCGNSCPAYQICCGGSCVTAGSAQHCGNCDPCPAGAPFCSFDFMSMGFSCNAG